MRGQAFVPHYYAQGLTDVLSLVVNFKKETNLHESFSWSVNMNELWWSQDLNIVRETDT